MTTAAILILVIATALSVMNMIIVLITNYKFRERMSEGGRMVLLLADISAVMGIISVLSNIIVLILILFDDQARGALVSAICILITTANVAVILRFRGFQNQKINMALMRNQQILAERNKILANISHEIRTPMNTIMGMNEVLLKENDLPDGYKEKLISISEASGALLHVINNLIDFTKIESQHLDIIETNYVLKELLQGIVDAEKPSITAKNIDFRITVNEQIPSVLRGDDIRIIQVINNILDNACKFTNTGLIAVDVDYEQVAEDRIKLIFKIQDTGMGIPEREREFVFRSSSVNNTRDDHRQKGAGLGLLISKNILDRMGGSINYETEIGVGTTFTLIVPQMVVDANPIGVFKGADENNKTYMFRAPGARVLVVDDNIVNLFVAKEILERYDIEVQTASSGQECIDIVNGNIFDIIFMDYVMPGMDGQETLKKIRSFGIDYLNRVPIVALTAQTSSGAGKVYRDEGFDSYLSKPLSVENLEDVLLKLLPSRFIIKKTVAQTEESDAELELERQSWYQRLVSVLDGVNVKKGLSLCRNDYDSYINLLRVIYSDGKNQIGKIRTAIAHDDMENYRITIHAIKSVTASAGDDELSAMCAEHEERSKANDFDYIRENVDTLVDKYSVLLKKIDVALLRESEFRGRTKQKVRTESGAEEIRKLASDLLAALENYEIDEAEKAIAQLDSLKLGEAREKAVSEIKDRLLMFDYEEASKIVKNSFGL